MGTRSDIIVQQEDGAWKRIYCHWDGYPEHNGRILFEYYNSQALAEALVAPGDLSSLAPDCGKPGGHTFGSPVEGFCVYYARDRGETDAVGFCADSLAAAWPEEGTWTEYTYVWADGAWWVADADEGTQALTLLSLALSGIAEPKPAIKAPWGVIGSRK